MINELVQNIDAELAKSVDFEIKNIPSLKGYAVSNDGRVFNTYNLNAVAQWDNGYGYKYVTIRDSEGKHNYRVSRLVAEAFLPNPDQLLCVDHIDSVKANNNVTNLRWCTYAQNNKYMLDNGNHGKALKVKDTLTGTIYNSIREAHAGFIVGYKKFIKMLKEDKVDNLKLLGSK